MWNSPIHKPKVQSLKTNKFSYFLKGFIFTVCVPTLNKCSFKLSMFYFLSPTDPIEQPEKKMHCLISLLQLG